VKVVINGHVASLVMTSEDERQLLAENPALRQVYEAHVSCFITCYMPRYNIGLESVGSCVIMGSWWQRKSCAASSLRGPSELFSNMLHAPV
jgi:hypothetical protein